MYPFLFLFVAALIGYYVPLELNAQEYTSKQNTQSGLQKTSPFFQQIDSKRMPWRKPFQPLYEINFGNEYPGHGLLYFRELEAWARKRNLLLLPDLPLRGLQDFKASLIPPSGLRFELDAPVFSRAYLYLDLAVYRALGETELPPAPVHWLEVIVNGYPLKTLYQKFQKTRNERPAESPLLIPIELEHIPEGKLRVLLRPNPQGSRFAIWDAFVSASPL